MADGGQRIAGRKEKTIMKYVINYCNGITENVECADLEAAKEAAVQGMNYTQANVKIENTEGELLSTSYWYGVEQSEEDTPLETIGTFGFYGEWVDE